MIPLQPLPPMQRLGWLPQSGTLKCLRSCVPAFLRYSPYDFTTEKVKVFSKERRARRDGVSEPVTYSGYELLIRVKDDHGEWHRCLPNPQGQHALIHDLEFLVEHFEIPEVPDLAALHPKKFAAYKRKLKKLERLCLTARSGRTQ